MKKRIGIKEDGRKKWDKLIKPKQKPQKTGLYESQDPKLLKLRDKWYEKLEDAGFVDLESYEKGRYFDCPFLDENASEVRQRIKAVKEARLDEYYRVCAAYLWEGAFRNDLERRIWELHTEGWTFGEISAYLRSKGAKIKSKSWIWTKIKQIRRRMLDGIQRNKATEDDGTSEETDETLIREMFDAFQGSNEATDADDSEEP